MAVPPATPDEERARRLRQQAELSGSLAPKGMGRLLNPGGKKWTQGYVIAWRQIRALPLGQRALAMTYAALMHFGGPIAMLMLLLGDGSLRTVGLILLVLLLLASFGATIFSAVRASQERSSKHREP